VQPYFLENPYLVRVGGEFEQVKFSIRLAIGPEQQRKPMLLLVFEGALFKFAAKGPASAPLFQLPPRITAAIAFTCQFIGLLNTQTANLSVTSANGFLEQSFNVANFAHFD